MTNDTIKLLSGRPKDIRGEPMAAPTSHSDEDATQNKRTCLSCFGRFPVQDDGTPVGGALPCGH